MKLFINEYTNEETGEVSRGLSVMDTETKVETRLLRSDRTVDEMIKFLKDTPNWRERLRFGNGEYGTYCYVGANKEEVEGV